MTNTEKTVTWGLMIFIAWELYRQQPGQTMGANAQGIQTPLWVRQLSQNIHNTDYYTQNNGIWGLCR